MKKKKKIFDNEKEALHVLYGMILVLVALIIFMVPLSGILGELLVAIFRLIFGYAYIIVAALMLLMGIYMIIKKKIYIPNAKVIVEIILLLIAIIFTIALIEYNKNTGLKNIIDFFNNFGLIFLGDKIIYSGLIGCILYSLVSALIKFAGSIALIIIVYFGIIALFLKRGTIQNISHKITSIKSKNNIKKESKTPKEKKELISIKPKNEKKKVNEEKVEEISSKKEKVVEKEQFSLSAPYNTYPNYQLPRLSLLDVQNISKSSANNVNAKQKAETLIKILNQFDINCWLQNIQIGPSITRFELGVDTSTRLNKITSLQSNIAMGLSAKKVNIEAPIPGKNAVGIEIENVERNAVRLRDLLIKVPTNKVNSLLLMALGKNLAGENEYGEINKMPHLLIAGSTGSGKSVCINSIIATLLFRCRPNEVKLLLIDPKKVEFTSYNDIPHLIAPVINDTKLAAKALNIVVQIMDYRYDVLHKKGVKDIDEYNNKCRNDSDYKYMYRLVVIIDELADLMLSHGKEIDGLIQRITQLARASGIHLIVATQRPSVDVITGTIKSNIPSRISFAVASATDSRIILDKAGAENLLGYGDMLYLPMGESQTRRIQGVYVSDDEIHRVTEAVKAQGKPMYEDAFLVDETLENDSNIKIDDPLFDECKKYIAQTHKASTSALSRRFSIGYNRAARIIDVLEQEGAIGPLNGSKPREVYINEDDVV